MTSLCVTQTKNMARIGAAPRGVRRRNTKLFELREDQWKTCTCRIGCRNSNLIPTMAREFTKCNAGVESEPAQRKSKSKVKLNFGLSPDFSVQLKVSLSQKLK